MVTSKLHVDKIERNLSLMQEFLSGLKELEYKKVATELGQRGVVAGEYSETLLKMAGYRNRMVHLYHEIGPAEIYDIIQNHLADIDRFIAEIVRYLEDYRKSQPSS